MAKLYQEHRLKSQYLIPMAIKIESVGRQDKDA